MVLRVARVITRLNVGGPTRHACLLQSGLPAFGVESIVLTGRVPDGEVEDEQAVSVLAPRRLEALGRPIRPWRDLSAYRALVRHLREVAPDVVHTHQAKAGLLGRRAANALGIPVIHTFHGHTFEGYWGSVMRRGILALERRLARRTAAIVVQSLSQRDDIVRFLGKEVASRLRLIPPAIDFTRLDDSGAVPSWRPDGETFVVAFVGRLDSVKDCPAFLEAFARARTRTERPLAALVAGGGDESTVGELRDKARALGVGEAVTWLGNCRDVGRVYRAADLVAMTSRNEGTPLVLIEALAAGCPVAAYDVGGVADVVGPYSNAELVERGDLDGMARAMAAAADRGRVRVTEAERQAVRKRHGAERLCRELARLYAEVVAGD